MLSTYFNLEEDFEEFLERFNDEFPPEKELEKQMLSVFKLIDKLNLEEKSRAFKKTDLFTLLVELHRALFKEKKHLKMKCLNIKLRFMEAMKSITTLLQLILST